MELQSLMAPWSHHASLGLPFYKFLLLDEEKNLYPIQSTVSLDFSVICS